MSDEDKPLHKIEVDSGNLYREESYTDLKVATIRRLVPVNSDGSLDGNRRPLFTAETQVLTQVGPMPIQSPVEAATLEEAIAKFPEAIHAAVERLMEEAKEMRRQEASRIVVPGTGAVPGAGPSLRPGGALDLG